MLISSWIKKFLPLFMGVLISPMTSLATTNNDTNGWYGFFNKSNIQGNFSWWTETQLRYNMDAEEMGQTLVRTGLLMAIDGSQYKSEFGLLYGYINTGLVKEHRFALQHSMAYLGFLEGFSHRIRYEFRTLEQGGAPSNRFRYLLRYQGPEICSNSKLVIWDEVFLNTEEGNTDETAHLDRNRFFAGLRIPFENMNMEVGYLNQLVPRNTGTQMDHVATVYMFF